MEYYKQRNYRKCFMKYNSYYIILEILIMIINKLTDNTCFFFFNIFSHRYITYYTKLILKATIDIYTKQIKSWQNH